MSLTDKELFWTSSVSAGLQLEVGRSLFDYTIEKKSSVHSVARLLGRTDEYPAEDSSDPEVVASGNVLAMPSSQTSARRKRRTKMRRTRHRTTTTMMRRSTGKRATGAPRVRWKRRRR